MANSLTLRKEIKDSKPEFKRQDFSHRPNLGTTGWRRPKGLHSKMRHKKKGHRASPEVGWGSPVDVEGMHKSGLFPIMIKCAADVAAINPKTQGAIIGAHVGNRAKVVLVQALLAKNVRILNVKDSQGFAATIAAGLKVRKEARAASLKKTEQKPATPQKKTEPKSEAPLTEGEKKEQERLAAQKVLTQKEQ